MDLIVHKYGGTSLGDIECIKRVARRIISSKDQGNDVVVVVSAMGNDTNRLVKLAKEITNTPDPREYDVLLASGEQISISLLSMMLIKLGYPAKSYTGFQVCIKTDNEYNKARIISIDDKKIKEDLANGKIVVVAGFQGIDDCGNITTLGRGGSDTTAVALAASLKAKECQIYTDVDGVYTTDPRIVPEAKRMDRVTFEEMLELSSLGAKVLQIRSVEFAGRYNVPLRVLSTFNDGPGTLISFEEENMEQPVVSGIAYSVDEAKVVIRGVPDYPGMAAKILGPIGEANIEVDMIVQNVAADGTTDFTFTVHRDDLDRASAILKSLGTDLGATETNHDDRIAKLSIVGVGMKSHAGVASRMFKVLGEEGINIHLISTSEIKVSVLVDEKYLELGVRALHEAFGL